MEELPEPVIAEATPLEERPFEDDELLEERVDFTDPAQVPELSVAVVGVRLPRRQAPTAPPPPTVTTAPVPVRAAVPPRRAAPQPIRVRAAMTPAVGAGRRGGATGTGRLVPTHRPHHYPASARGRGLTGVARVEMLVAPDGSVARVRLVASSGHPTLDQAALGSARQWRYRAPGEWRRARQSFTFMFR
jgi:protein TonB